ncbi:hypothetical protein C8Q74DRAFT_1446827 [Fomes fomentarius]|nr:hypothetical protein C8Q74DRAFT_1446827 [Fomes fomentarius]
MMGRTRLHQVMMTIQARTTETNRAQGQRTSRFLPRIPSLLAQLHPRSHLIRVFHRNLGRCWVRWSKMVRSQYCPPEHNSPVTYFTVNPISD